LGHCSSTSSRLYPVLHACRKIEENLLLPQRLDDFYRKKKGRKKETAHREKTRRTDSQRRNIPVRKLDGKDRKENRHQC
jgi:hypothetical protein